MRVVTSVSLSEEMASDLEMFTRDPVKTKSEIIRDTLKAYLWGSQFLDLRKVLRPEAEAEGLLTDEDAFKIFFEGCLRPQRLVSGPNKLILYNNFS